MTPVDKNLINVVTFKIMAPVELSWYIGDFAYYDSDTPEIIRARFEEFMDQVDDHDFLREMFHANIDYDTIGDWVWDNIDKVKVVFSTVDEEESLLPN